ncbi:unnamed protein product [Brachionus calyciflorus]|uniref:Ribonuclease H1 n=1 Tax=Brachionus calyciflorus TaxID=104777 RepID=A0A813MCD4_9BILA|nr:unnamed protein product [Brachionus calyciflorus]
MPFYAVRNGFEPGIYLTWEQCEKQVKGFSKAVYKKFETKTDAITFIIKKSPSKNISTDLEKDKIDSPKISNPDLTKKNLDQTSSTNNKRKLDQNYKQKNESSNLANSTTVGSNESKDLKNSNEQPAEKKARKNLENADSFKINSAVNKPDAKVNTTTISHQKSYLTEYEDKKHDFSFKSQKMIVYTDGACSNNGKPNATAGIGVFWGTNHPLNISKRLNGLQTNNRAEITAAVVAISQALTYNASELTIYTDSKFMMNAITDWIRKWKVNGWKSSTGEPVKNIDDFKRLDDLCSKIKVNWEYVPGHKGHHGNEEADKLATKCLK